MTAELPSVGDEVHGVHHDHVIMVDANTRRYVTVGGAVYWSGYRLSLYEIEQDGGRRWHGEVGWHRASRQELLRVAIEQSDSIDL